MTCSAYPSGAALCLHNTHTNKKAEPCHCYHRYTPTALNMSSILSMAKTYSPLLGFTLIGTGLVPTGFLQYIHLQLMHCKKQYGMHETMINMQCAFGMNGPASRPITMKHRLHCIVYCPNTYVDARVHRKVVNYIQTIVTTR